jgi:hypothetical protein
MFWTATVTPVPSTDTVGEESFRCVPFKVTLTVVPALPDAGRIDVKVGGARFTVKLSGWLVPPAVVTVIRYWPGVASPSIVSVIVRDVELVTLTLEAETSEPLTFTVVPPVTKFAPVIVTVGA